MKKRRLILIFSIMMLLVMIFLLPSPLFRLKEVRVSFFDPNYKEVSLSSNSVFTSTKNVEAIIDKGEFDFGELIFFSPKDKYAKRLENSFPYLKVLSIVSLFPNKLRLNLQERQEMAYMSCEGGYIILDREFKILRYSTSCPSDRLFIQFYSENGSEVSFFDFFEISHQAFCEGQFLSENNFVFTGILNIFNVIESVGDNFSNFILKLAITKDDSNLTTLSIFSTSPYGVTLKVEDLLNDFDYKLTKLLSALNTLYFKENVKTTHGTLKINTAKNVSWQE